VLLTRARRGLVVVGHQETLRHDPYWRRWLDFAARERVIVDRREWLATLRRAAASCDAASPLLPLLPLLRPLEYAPLTPNAFRAHVRASLAKEAAAAAAHRDTAAPLCELLSAAAAGWRGWAAEVREALSAAGGEAGWKGVRKTLLARHAATHRRVGGQAAALRDAARDAVPAELWVKRGVRLALPEGDAARRSALERLRELCATQHWTEPASTASAAAAGVTVEVAISRGARGRREARSASGSDEAAAEEEAAAALLQAVWAQLSSSRQEALQDGAEEEEEEESGSAKRRKVAAKSKRPRSCTGAAGSRKKRRRGEAG